MIPVSAPAPATAAAARATVKALGGSLVIVGGGLMPQNIRDRFVKLAGGEKAKLVVIPTASQRAQAGRLENLPSYSYWMPLVRAHKVASVVFLHTRRTDEANNPSFVKPLTEASGVWFSGGDQSFLTSAYKNTAVEREVRNLLARGGVVGGTSAGAAVMSEVMIRNGITVAEVGTGFGFLPGVIVDQHFQQRKRLTRLQGVLARYPRYLGMGIDEQTGIVVQGQSVTVLGNNHVHVCFPPSQPRKNEVKVFHNGDQINLAELNRLISSRTRAKAD